MFIVSKANLNVRRADGSLYSISEGYMGDIPDDIAAHWMIQAAIKSGVVFTSDSHLDKDLIKADAVAEEAAAEADIRPDAKKGKKKKTE
jgi:hypothetical protein